MVVRICNVSFDNQDAHMALRRLSKSMLKQNSTVEGQVKQEKTRIFHEKEGESDSIQAGSKGSRLRAVRAATRELPLIIQCS